MKKSQGELTSTPVFSQISVLDERVGPGEKGGHSQAEGNRMQEELDGQQEPLVKKTNK